ncbi:MAG: metallophosphoesterase family protein [bacterium]
MRYAIVSDIHAHLQAWEAVLRDIASSRVDGIICLGDVVGYGPNPVEVLQSVHRHVDALALGNHDAVVCGKLDPGLFNDHARDMIAWTRAALSPKAVEFLAEWPLVLVGEGFRCAHGEFTAPGAFHYVIDPHEALPSWQVTTEPLLFTGHTHLPGIHVIGPSGTPHRLDAQDFTVEDGKRYLISVGSVGFPRDADPRAGYCIYDTEARSVLWRRIPFDSEAHGRAMAAAGLTGTAGRFLMPDPLTTLQPIRTKLDFAPATCANMQAQNAVMEQDLARTLRRGIARWKLLAIALLGVILATLAGLLLHRPESPPPLSVSCPAAELEPRSAGTPAADPSGQPGNLLAPIPAAAGGAEIPGWRYCLSDRTRQSVTASNAAMVLSSTLPGGRIRLEAAPVDLAGTSVRRVCMSGRIHTSADFSGSVELVADLLCEDADGKRVLHPRREQKAFRLPGDDGSATRKTFDLLKETRCLTLALEGSFTGTVTVAELVLTPAPKR